jgi:ABC-type multidrug transport system permease subunit
VYLSEIKNIIVINVFITTIFFMIFKFILQSVVIHLAELSVRLQSPIAVAARSKARTVFARSNTAIVGSNPTEPWMFVCAFILCLHSLR